MVREKLVNPQGNPASVDWRTQGYVTGVKDQVAIQFTLTLISFTLTQMFLHFIGYIRTFPFTFNLIFPYKGVKCVPPMWLERRETLGYN